MIAKSMEFGMGFRFGSFGPGRQAGHPKLPDSQGTCPSLDLPWWLPQPKGMTRQGPIGLRPLWRIIGSLASDEKKRPQDAAPCQSNLHVRSALRRTAGHIRDFFAGSAGDHGVLAGVIVHIIGAEGNGLAQIFQSNIKGGSAPRRIKLYFLHQAN